MVGLGLLPRQFLFGGAQLTHHVVHLAVQRAGVLEGLLGVFFGLGGGLRAEPTISQQTVGEMAAPPADPSPKATLPPTVVSLFTSSFLCL